MACDVTDLRDFYHDPLGRATRRLLRRRIRGLWPDTTGLRLLGLGYATPYLRPFLGEAERVLAMMPDQIGAHAWPADAANRVALVAEEALPLPDMAMDRVLMVHGLEHARDPRGLLREVWRVLAGGGRLLLIVPNRRGIWARLDRTPFGHGHPYSEGQIGRTLRDNLFHPEQSGGALSVPPALLRWSVRAAPAVERAGSAWFSPIAGVLVIEATKRLHAGIPTGQPAPARIARILTPRPGLAPAPG